MGKSTRQAQRFLVVGSRRVPTSDVLGLSEIAELFGITERTALNYAKRPDFPAPLAQLNRGRVWHREDVTAWGKRMLPLKTGRPRKERGSDGS
jgi:hypothetical protein